jgi:hypothetical protein
MLSPTETARIDELEKLSQFVLKHCNLPSQHPIKNYIVSRLLQITQQPEASEGDNA